MIQGLPARPKFVDFNSRTFTRAEMQQLALVPSILRLDFCNCPVTDDLVAEICTLPKLHSLWLEGTLVTDAVFPHLAQIKSLKWLILDRTSITGSGFGCFPPDSRLETLWVSDTVLNDQALPFLARLPRLSGLVMQNTRVSAPGLKALAQSPTVKINTGNQFPREMLDEFEALQRSRTNEKLKSYQPTPAEVVAAKAVLLDFFAAMNEWERAVAASHSRERGTIDWRREQCAEIFRRFCINKEGSFSRPMALSYSEPPRYKQEALVDSFWPSRNRVFFYTKHQNGSQYRYLVTKVNGTWLVDQRAWFSGGWAWDYL